MPLPGTTFTVYPRVLPWFSVEWNQRRPDRAERGWGMKEFQVELKDIERVIGRCIGDTPILFGDRREESVKRRFMKHICISTEGSRQGRL
jgi:hypothetical protein